MITTQRIRLVVLAFALAGGAVAQGVMPAGRTITVHGTGSVNVTPDQVKLTLQVSVKAETAVAALSASNRKTREVLAILHAQGIDAGDIQTSRVSVNQIVDYSKNVQPPPVVGYMGVNDLSVLFRGTAMEKVGEFLDRATGAGASNFGPMSFESSRKQELEREALKGAFTDALARAGALAAACKATLGRVLSVSESANASASMMRLARMGVSDGGAPVMPGELAMTATVDVVFELQ